MNASYTYNQAAKISARHKSLLYAVNLLTTTRNRSCCVERDYVRRAYDYFMSFEECREKDEAEKIEIKYINYWEKLHDSCVGHKHPEDLVVCYLAGPEPHNDFEELTNIGILPQNIWAFESDLETYQTALTSYEDGVFPQPKIIKMPIEHFFKQTPKKFDIVYIDACGAIPSSQHALRCVTSLCKYHRLNSPGILITNFANPDIESDNIKEEYKELMSQYFLLKKWPNEPLVFDRGNIGSVELAKIRKAIDNDFPNYYGEFISFLLRDISSIIVPVQRFANSNFFKSIISEELPQFTALTSESINNIQNNSLSKYFSIIKYLQQMNAVNSKIKSLINEFQGMDTYPIDIYQSFLALINLKSNGLKLNKDIQKIQDYFERGDNIYQFLDKPHSNLFFDLIINQIAYPMHYNAEAIRRYSYVAKQKEMYMDITVLDECRYIYEWLPAVHQVQSAFNNRSWQYVFRFALDGLVKNRFNYNNEFFFQGSVIKNNITGFQNRQIQLREKLY